MVYENNADSEIESGKHTSIAVVFLTEEEFMNLSESVPWCTLETGITWATEDLTIKCHLVFLDNPHQKIESPSPMCNISEGVNRQMCVSSRKSLSVWDAFS